MKNFNVMKQILVMLCAGVLVLDANAQTEWPFNPDIDGNQVINFNDFLYQVALYEMNYEVNDTCHFGVAPANFDGNNDSFVSIVDMLMFFEVWGMVLIVPCPE